MLSYVFRNPSRCLIDKVIPLRALNRYSTHVLDAAKRKSILDLNKKYLACEPLSMCTAYDYITASWAQKSNCDMILIGDSLAMTSLGYKSTTDLPFDEFKYHVKSVCRAEGSSLVVADMPFGSYETSHEVAISNALQLLKLDSNVASLKIEVGMHTKDKYTINLVKEMCSRGIPIMGHIGLTPQRSHSLGGFRVQGNKSYKEIKELLETALVLQDAGCWALVLECIPQKVAGYITSKLNIPTIGIGAGTQTSGQVLVMSDMLGMLPGGVPKFVKQYSSIHRVASDSISKYIDEVESGKFPSNDTHTFKIKNEIWEEFINHEQS
ncbi:hypothetical protein Kpol_242p6 [Vanderwaltozyma polyspora DSM 70294]|uniref:3-methyl-2-oxobutanoate hydroxymethyltransferase n=1 Tax=Vanderwaltozyma polyspora (strain ATCC 22028 / DSM 70294 / BCRC 21397 / CBS 2163 / NBRC 10782 / NRRL Y-8283 / UCD 57-17) TaxID=436907 RepID=A7TTC6_VANPO|nr:uncharacterized protein Kpol_242p6 [Vanderwaltozyma polyspora DSM 70294]EDO14483.1 hypothetical protein Kpol_242p6 [Vanderwaltozyma polyspora DSM 70294]